MKSSVSQSNEYLQALERKEKKRRRTKLFILGAVGVIAAGSAFMVPKILGKQAGTSALESPKYRSFYATELTDDKVRAFFTGGNNRMVIRYPGEERRDTVVSYNEYASLISRRTDWQFNVVSNSDLFSDEEGDDISVSAVNDALQVALGNSGESLPAGGDETSEEDITKDFGFRVRGDRAIGEELRIQVLNFRPEIKYEMDFGEGTRLEIDRATQFAYNEPGVYVITLRASGEGVPRRIYATYPLTIEDPNAIQIEEPMIADNESDLEEIASESDQPTLNEALLASSASATNAIDQEPASMEAPNTAIPANNAVGEKAGQATTSGNAPTQEAASHQPFFAVSKMPEFPGGNRGLSKFIQKNLVYPRVSNETQRGGKVTVRFVVDENGRARNPHVVKGLGNPYDQEVVRMINSMPKWAPGEQNGKRVPVYKSLRISFSVDG